MRRTPFAALILGALFAFAVQAQDPQKPEPKPDAEPTREPASEPAPGPGQQPDPKILGEILSCLAEGLPQGWKKAWFVIDKIDRDASGVTRRFAAKYFYATEVNDRKGKPFQPCDAERVRDGVAALNAYLPDSQKRWTGATISFMDDGEFEARYDFTPRKPATAKPAAKPAAKEKQESSK